MEVKAKFPDLLTETELADMRRRPWRKMKKERRRRLRNLDEQIKIMRSSNRKKNSK